jgi:hypothetical protein
MEQQAILDELLALLENNNVVTRTEPLGGRGGGLCKLKDKEIFFVDSDASPPDMAAICAQALTRLCQIEEIYIKPQVRDFIEKNT